MDFFSVQCSLVQCQSPGLWSLHRYFCWVFCVAEKEGGRWDNYREVTPPAPPDSPASSVLPHREYSDWLLIDKVNLWICGVLTWNDKMRTAVPEYSGLYCCMC